MGVKKKTVLPREKQLRNFYTELVSKNLCLIYALLELASNWGPRVAGFGGVTPLHLAVMSGHHNIVGLLVTRGANVKVILK